MFEYWYYRVTKKGAPVYALTYERHDDTKHSTIYVCSTLKFLLELLKLIMRKDVQNINIEKY